MTSIPGNARKLTDDDIPKIRPGSTRLYVPVSPQFPAGASGIVQLVGKPHRGDFLHVRIRYNGVTETLPFGSGDLLTTLRAPKKAPVKRLPAKKTPAKRTPAKKTPPKKTTRARKVAAPAAPAGPAVDAQITFARSGGAWSATSSRRGSRPVPLAPEQVAAMCVLLGLPPAPRGTR